MVAGKALIVNEDKVLVVREASYDEGSNEGKWDVPGGRIRPEEALLDGLKREVKEESGLDIEVGEVLGVCELFQTIKGESCHVIRIYYHDKYEWVDPQYPDKREYVRDILEMFDKVV